MVFMRTVSVRECQEEDEQPERLLGRFDWMGCGVDAPCWAGLARGLSHSHHLIYPIRQYKSRSGYKLHGKNSTQAGGGRGETLHGSSCLILRCLL